MPETTSSEEQPQQQQNQSNDKNSPSNNDKHEADNQSSSAVSVRETLNAEEQRLVQNARREKNWQRWGPYLSERQWGTTVVREDYSANGDCWNYFPHDHARSRTYRWGEDGLFGISDRQCRIAFAYALWNEHDPILKERLFGLTGPEGNHGEDVKELYYYLDSTPTHSYMKALYKYPHNEYPYRQLAEENGRRTRSDPEYEIEDTGIFDDDAYFDVVAEYCKADAMDILCRLTVHNRSPSATARIHILPTVWLRNTWSWGCDHEGCTKNVKLIRPVEGYQLNNCMQIEVESLNTYHCEFEIIQPDGGGGNQQPEFLFTNNETNTERLYNTPNPSPYVKDSFHRYLCDSEKDAVNPKQRGTKCCAHYVFELKPNESCNVRSRLYDPKRSGTKPGEAFSANNFDDTFTQRQRECDEFYAALQSKSKSDNDNNEQCADEKLSECQKIQRQAYAGMLWSKQFYHYVIKDWLTGDRSMPPPAPERRLGDGARNVDWEHLFNRDVISMPDKWEYPWYATWDIAFHTITLSDVDHQFAKDQLLLLLREWFMHPNGQLPAYEFNFNDVNPPVHAWAVMRVYKAAPVEQRDRRFLARCFQKLLLNFTWWVNRKDINGKNIFGGGFLGLDNIGVFDRSRPLPAGQQLQQADGTAWMAFYAATMLDIAIELAHDDSTYEDMASKFFEHFVRIVDAMNSLDNGKGLWNEEDGFYYDHLVSQNNEADGQPTVTPVKIRSIVGLVPLFGVLVIEKSPAREKLPEFFKRTIWFLKYRSDLTSTISFCHEQDKFDNVPDENSKEGRMLLAVPSRERLERVLKYLLDENEFLSPFGIRSVSKVHAEHPYEHQCPNGGSMRVEYAPGESTSELFGGNSNWRGPIWFCINYLIIMSLNRCTCCCGRDDYFYGEHLQVECPTGSGKKMRLSHVAEEIGRRLMRIFLPNDAENNNNGGGCRPCHGSQGRLSKKYANDPHFKDLLLFHEYFHAESGQGLGASHQTGWTGLVANCINMCHAVPHGGMLEPKWVLESQKHLGARPQQQQQEQKQQKSDVMLKDENADERVDAGENEF